MHRHQPCPARWLVLLYLDRPMRLYRLAQRRHPFFLPYSAQHEIRIASRPPQYLYRMRLRRSISLGSAPIPRTPRGEFGESEYYPLNGMSGARSSSLSTALTAASASCPRQ